MQADEEPLMDSTNAPAPAAAAPTLGAAPAPAAPPAPAKTLVIAEKRSVGKTIAAFLGCRADRGGWIEGRDYDVTWAQGHLLRLLMPDEYEARGEWRLRGTEALPIIPAPDEWRWRVSEDRGADAQFQTLASLATSGRYARVVNACDPDREGQAIADLALWFVGNRLPVDRLWCSSLEDAALRKAFGRMRPDEEYRGLFQSALARSKADWLVGMNASRLYSAAMRSRQSVGRVRTPTLALVVERDRQIEAFNGKDSYKVRLDLGEGLLVTGEPHPREDAARKVLEQAKGAQCAIDSVERKRCREGAPTLLNTTGAQKLASERHGMSPDTCDRALQSLYEKKLATYPRTDSKFVNAEDGETLESLVALVSDAAHVGEAMSAAFRGMPHDVSKVVDDSKVEGHGALLPTRQLTAERLAALEGAEADVARMLCESLLAAVAPDRIYDRASVKATCNGMAYSASANTDVDPGWKRLRKGAAGGAGDDDPKNGAEAEDDGKCRIPDDLVAPSSRTVVGGEVRKTKAQPPKRYTDATLLAAMEHAERFVEGDELKAAIKDSSSHSGGIGTPATRAGIIASLVERGYLDRKGSTLTSTPEGRALVDEVAPDLRSVELTARMERDLYAIDKDGADPALFMGEVVELVRGVVSAQLARPVRTSVPKGEVLGKCPCCGGNVVDTGAERSPYLCQNSRRERVEGPDGSAVYRDCGACSFKLYRTFMGAEISPANAKKLLAGKPVLVKGLQRKDGTKIDRMVALDPEQGFRPRIAADQSVKVGTCPKCGGRVLDVGNEKVPFLCENNIGNRAPQVPAAGGTPAADAATPATAAGGAPATCDFRLYREFMGKKLAKTDVTALLALETATVKGLVSKRDGQKFNAYVVLDPKQGFRPKVVGYPEEQPVRKAEPPERPSAPGKAATGKTAPGKNGTPDDQMTLPGLEW